MEKKQKIYSKTLLQNPSERGLGILNIKSYCDNMFHLFKLEQRTSWLMIECISKSFIFHHIFYDNQMGAKLGNQSTLMFERFVF